MADWAFNESSAGSSSSSSSSSAAMNKPRNKEDVQCSFCKRNNNLEVSTSSTAEIMDGRQLFYHRNRYGALFVILHAGYLSSTISGN